MGLGRYSQAYKISCTHYRCPRAVELLAYTRPNPILLRDIAAAPSDVATIWNGKSTFCANLMEYAARLCYLSTARMGTSANFITARIREGHEDVIEHVVATFRFSGTSAPRDWRRRSRHCETTSVGSDEWIVSANARVWLQFFRDGLALEAMPAMRRLAPEVYAEFETELHAPRMEAEPEDDVKLSPEQMEALVPYEDSPLRVTLLGYTQPTLSKPQWLTDHGSACFLFEGISRACTHQLVRHRLASFSQESQRYVDLKKGAWNAIVPPKIAHKPEAQAIMESTWQDLQQSYRALRSLGIRKEDARFLLPNATETRIVTTMNFAAWQHFLWLRAVDKAAQWEIRQMGIQVLKMLYAIAPSVFAEHWQVYQASLR